MTSDSGLILAIDQGTGSTKAMLLSARGRVVATGAATIGQRHPKPGWVEQDPMEIWMSIHRAVRECVSPAVARRVDGVALSVQRESVVVWEQSTGRAVSPVLGWQDERTRSRATELAEHADHVAAITGLPLDPMFSALKGSWLLDQLDQGRKRAASGTWRVGTLDAWLLAQFDATDPVTEIGNASRTQLLNIDKGVWEDSLLELFDIPAAALPRVVSSTGPFPSIRGLRPLPDGVPVLAVLGDSHAALFGQAGWRPGAVKATYGTGCSVMVLGTRASEDFGICSTIAWQIEHIALAAEANIRSGGRTLTWLAELFGVDVNELASEAESAAGEGVTLVPAFGGLGAPSWDRDATALLCGFALGTQRAQLSRAALESVAFQVDDVLTAFADSGIPIGEVACDGGLTRSAALMQLQADLSGIPVRRSVTENLSALGVANLAGIVVGHWTLADLGARVDHEIHDPQRSQTFLPSFGEPQRETLRDQWRSAMSRARSARPA